MSSRQHRQASVGSSNYHQPTPVYSIYSGLQPGAQPTYYASPHVAPPRRSSASPVSDTSSEADRYSDSQTLSWYRPAPTPRYNSKDVENMIPASPKRRTRRVTLSPNLAYAFSSNDSDSSAERDHKAVPRQLRFDGKVLVQEISPIETTFGFDESEPKGHYESEGTSTSSTKSRSRTWCRLNGADGAPGQYPTLHMARINYERQLREEMATYSLSGGGSQSSDDEALEEEFRLLSLERSRQRAVSTTSHSDRTRSARYDYE